MYHMGFHLEAQRQQRAIAKKKAEIEKKGPSQGNTTIALQDDLQRQETRSGNRPATRMTTAPLQSRGSLSQSGAKSQTAILGYQRIGQPTLGQRAFSRPEQYEDRWLNNRFRIRHDRNLVPLPFRKVDVAHN